MPYREIHGVSYSLARLEGAASSACAWLSFEMLRRDWPPAPEPFHALLEAAKACVGFHLMLEEIWEEAVSVESEAEAQRWREESTAAAIEALRERDEREDVYAFLFDLATARMMNPAELELLARLREAWRIG